MALTGDRYLYINKFEGGATLWDSLERTVSALFAGLREAQIPPDDMLPFMIVVPFGRPFSRCCRGSLAVVIQLDPLWIEF